MNSELRAEAQFRYDEAVERRAAVVEKWAAEGQPILGKGGATGQADVPHPLIRMIQEADALCDRLAKTLSRRATTGRPPGAVSAPDREAPPRVLKAVK